jgi:hypothetical protein
MPNDVRRRQLELDIGRTWTFSAFSSICTRVNDGVQEGFWKSSLSPCTAVRPPSSALPRPRCQAAACPHSWIQTGFPQCVTQFLPPGSKWLRSLDSTKSCQVWEFASREHRTPNARARRVGQTQCGPRGTSNAESLRRLDSTPEPRAATNCPLSTLSTEMSNVEKGPRAPISTNIICVGFWKWSYQSRSDCALSSNKILASTGVRAFHDFLWVFEIGAIRSPKSDWFKTGSGAVAATAHRATASRCWTATRRPATIQRPPRCL